LANPVAFEHKAEVRAVADRASEVEGSPEGDRARSEGQGRTGTEVRNMVAEPRLAEKASGRMVSEAADRTAEVVEARSWDTVGVGAAPVWDNPAQDRARVAEQAPPEAQADSDAAEFRSAVRATAVEAVDERWALAHSLAIH
jgi:ElaB/YqjD/DUF883 family membrane-anchored ribosome-binding protein